MLNPKTKQWMDDIDAYCREQTGMAGTWCVFHYERIGKAPESTDLTYMRFTGNYLDEQGDFLNRKWCHDQTTERTVVVSCKDFDAWAAKRREAVAC